MAHRKPRKFSVAPQGRPNSEINVTPLVDVVLVLLIIFMVVTPLMEKDIEVRVPQSEQVEDVAEVPPDQLVVALDAQGRFSLNYEPLEDAQYVDRLKRVLAARAAGDRLVFFAADDKALYARLVLAMDGARRAGADTLGMMTDPVPVPGDVAPGALPPESPGAPAPVPEPAPGPPPGSGPVPEP